MPAVLNLTQRDTNRIVLLYAKKSPAAPAFSDYYTDADITAVSGVVVSRAGAVLEAGLTLVYDADLKGYVLDYDFSAHVAEPWLSIRLNPTRAVGVPSALTAPKIYELTLADALKRQDEIQAAIPSTTGLALETTSQAIKTKTDNLPASPASEGTVTAVGLLAARIIDDLENRLVVNLTNSRLELYDDIGTSIIRSWPLKDKDGNAIVATTPSFERGVPT